MPTPPIPRPSTHYRRSVSRDQRMDEHPGSDFDRFDGSGADRAGKHGSLCEDRAAPGGAGADRVAGGRGTIDAVDRRRGRLQHRHGEQVAGAVCRGPHRRFARSQTIFQIATTWRSPRRGIGIGSHSCMNRRVLSVLADQRWRSRARSTQRALVKMAAWAHAAGERSRPLQGAAGTRVVSLGKGRGGSYDRIRRRHQT
jgi:hypothetical protein